MEVNRNNGITELYDSSFIDEMLKKQQNQEQTNVPFANLLNDLMKDETIENIKLHKPQGEVIVGSESTKIISLNNQPGEIIKFGGRRYFIDENGKWKKCE